MKKIINEKITIDVKDVSASPESIRHQDLRASKLLSKNCKPNLLSKTHPQQVSRSPEKENSIKQIGNIEAKLNQNNKNLLKIIKYKNPNEAVVQEERKKCMSINEIVILPVIKVNITKGKESEIQKINEEYENSPDKTNLKQSQNNSILIKTNEDKGIKKGSPLMNIKSINLTVEKEKIDPNFHYYIIVTGNNSALIKKCMSHRINWKECQNNASHFNFKWQPVSSGTDYDSFNQTNNKQAFNHFENHAQISNKLNLFINLMKYCENNSLELFNFLPFTIIIQYDNISYIRQIENFSFLFNNINNFINPHPSNELKQTKKNGIRKYISLFSFNYPNDKLGGKTNCLINSSHYAGKNIWLLKAPDLNRGRCIRIVNNLGEILKLIKKFNHGVMREFKDEEEEKSNPYEGGVIYEKIATNRKNNKDFNSVNFMDLLKEDDRKRAELERLNFGSGGKKYRTSIMLLQKYIENPLLYNNRKFDIRVWVLINHSYDVYAFKEGHLKTASLNYTNENIDCYVHLTNYSVQKYNNNFSKYEYGNEVPFQDFQTFLENNLSTNKKINLKSDIWKRITEIITISTKAVKDKFISNRKFNFEIFGYDFIMDANLNVYLLEINTNPGLEESSPLIKMLVPRMIDDALRLTIDLIFEPKYSNLVEGKFYSLFPVENYSDTENLWEYVCNLSDKKKRE